MLERFAYSFLELCDIGALCFVSKRNRTNIVRALATAKALYSSANLTEAQKTMFAIALRVASKRSRNLSTVVLKQRINKSDAMNLVWLKELVKLNQQTLEQFEHPSMQNRADRLTTCVYDLHDLLFDCPNLTNLELDKRDAELWSISSRLAKLPYLRSLTISCLGDLRGLASSGLHTINCFSRMCSQRCRI